MQLLFGACDCVVEHKRDIVPALLKIRMANIKLDEPFGNKVESAVVAARYVVSESVKRFVGHPAIHFIFFLSNHFCSVLR